MCGKASFITRGINMQKNMIRPRLKWFADRVRQGVLFADIGTDHAKLPVSLVQSGKVTRAIAADIGTGPICRARAYINACGLAGKIDTFICDGVTGLPIKPPADIAVCGMGGETIRNIIKAAPILKNENIRLLLQPMTDFSLLRQYLAENGFIALEEDIVSSDGRMYQCMIVSYCGKPYTLSAVEAELGARCIQTRSNTFLRYVKRRMGIVQKCIDGKRGSGADATVEEALLAAYQTILEEKA